jgi:hypothetical protein
MSLLVLKHEAARSGHDVWPVGMNNFTEQLNRDELIEMLEISLNIPFVRLVEDR